MSERSAGAWRKRQAGMFAAAALWCGAAFASAPVVVLNLDGAVSPATADYVVRGMQRAADDGARLIVLKMDTPGGLDTSMRQIIKQILSSTVPVATFVSPSGARAASAGTYILYASHIAAMSPATNLGAATPVPIGIGGPPGEGDDKAKDKDKPKAADKEKAEGKKDRSAKKEQDPPKGNLTQKQINDAAAYIRGLAQLRGRNVEWAEKAVRDAVSLSAKEAQRINVVDLIANDVKDLLQKIDGRKVTVQGVERKLETKDATWVAVDPDWRHELLAVITNPSVALILMMIGIYGLIFEFSNPGFVVPGVVGGICLLLALYAFQLLPVNYAGLGLILLGLAFIVAEAFLPSFGALGIGGAVALVIGAVILIEPQAAGEFAVPLPFVVTLGIVSSGIVFAIVGMAAKARGRAVVSGIEEMTGAPGEILDDMQVEGWARVRGENWRVVSKMPLARGQKVRVARVDGLTLSVEPESNNTEGAKS